MKRPKAKLARTKGTTTTDDTPKLEAMEHKGELLIHELWQNGTVSVHDMRVGNTYAKSHLAKIPEECMQEADRAKKKMYLEACLQQLRNFSPFISSVAATLL